MKKNKHIYELYTYTEYSKLLRLLFKYNPLIYFTSNIKEKNGIHILKHNGKEYKFTLLSDENIQKVDKKRLHKLEKRYRDSIIRTLKIFARQSSNYNKLIVAKTNMDKFICLIDHNNKIIDYSKNIIMDKSDYYELFDVVELNTLDRFDVFLIYTLMDDLDIYNELEKLLLCNKEMIDDISKNYDYKFKYDSLGINAKNHFLFGNDCDVLFNTKDDTGTWKYDYIRNLLAEFTLNPEKKNRFIIKLKNKKYKCILPFMTFNFKILSDFIENKDVKENLLTEDRYGKCHRNSIYVAKGFEDTDNEDLTVYIVGGMQKANEIDSAYHSWVELIYPDREYVVDYNANIIMNKKDYYKIFGAEAIERTEINEYKKTEDNLDKLGLNMYNIFVNMFGEEFKKDTERVLKMFNK